jgi:hypothetical protein
MSDFTNSINELSILLGLNPEKLGSIKINHDLLADNTLLLYSKLKTTEYVDSIFTQEKLENEKGEGLVSLKVQDDLNEEIHNERSLFTLVKNKNIEIKSSEKEKESSSLIKFVAQANSPNLLMNIVLNMSSQFIDFITENSCFDIKKSHQNVSKTINSLYQSSIENHKKQQSKQKRLQDFMIRKQQEREQKRVIKIEKQQQEAEEKINKKTKNKQNNKDFKQNQNTNINNAEDQVNHNEYSNNSNYNEKNPTKKNKIKEDPRNSKTYNSNNRNYENDRRPNHNSQFHNTYHEESYNQYSNDGVFNQPNNSYFDQSQSSYYGNGQGGMGSKTIKSGKKAHKNKY